MCVEEGEVRYSDAISNNNGMCRPCCRSSNKGQEIALRSLGLYRIVDRRPDGCLIVETGGKRYFVDYEGRVFREIHIKELRKRYAQAAESRSKT
jgi:hypothetical protein